MLSQASAPAQSAPDLVVRTRGRDVERLNAVRISIEQIAAALDVNGIGVIASANDPVAAAALDARIAALARWRAAYDPREQSNREALLEAAARFPLSEQEDGLGFEPAGFQELALFIEELPW